MSVASLENRGLTVAQSTLSRPTSSSNNNLSTTTAPASGDRLELSHESPLYSSDALEGLREALKRKNIDLFL